MGKSNSDYSVLPRHKDLRHELLHNAHATISEREYDVLIEKSRRLLEGYPLTAKDVGARNYMCKIKPGTPMKIEHVIALKLYTDYPQVRQEFTKHCRRSCENEPMRSFIHLNSEIAHWCRYLKESIMLFGETMPDTMVLYSAFDEDMMMDAFF